LTEFSIIAREVSAYRTRFEAIEKRLDEVDEVDEVEKVNERLEDATQTSARASGFRVYWNAV
jgi:hypothetical protein